MLRRTPLRSYTPLKRTGFKTKKRKPLRNRAKSLKNKLWALFSEWVRRRDADHAGMNFCVSCGKPGHWKALQAGHYYAKSLGLSIYFDERNVQPQCAGCNLWRHGNLPDYALALKSKYGEGILEELQALRRQTRKISTTEYEELIEVYKAKLAALDAGQKGSEAA